ncbi:hypothetical protein FOA52_012886 [Chlamydomonas sp. UWO 241]|nr:hypothetical protein FOA52_012886 [Chlamydomonas sp. UWO 241]
MDDPLSAVDSHVGRAMFSDCIRGTLVDKTIILVTNALQYLPNADNVIWMENGRIRAQGTYAQLVGQGLDIAELAHIDAESEEPKSASPGGTPAGGGSPSKAAPGGSRPSLDFAGDARFAKSITLKRIAADEDRNLTGVEGREEGNLALSVVTKYLNAGGGWWVCIILVLLFTAEQGARAYTDLWVGIWFQDKYDYGVAPGWFYLGIYLLLGLTFATIVFVRSVMFLFMCVRAAVNLHNGLLDHLLRLPKSFFDQNPQGRILNRFSRDVDIMDLTLPATLIQLAGSVATLIANIVVIAIATKWFAIAIPFLIILYFIIQRFYIPTARELQRIEAITRSPIYSKFSEALAGVPTIRAFRKEAHFTDVSDGLMERNAMVYVTQKLAAAWLAMRLDWIGLAVLTGTGALCIAGNIDPALAGLAILYALDLTRYLKHGTNMASLAEANFNSVERIVEFMEPEPEAAADTSPDVLKLMPKDWPTHGAIEVEGLVMRYRPEMPLVLKGVSFSVLAGEKVGLVGRTGSGKSSILLALFRMVEPEGGRVLIDGVDTSTLGVRHLRSKMSIIPQDPFLYAGTVRRNLDPLEEYSEPQLWDVLESVGLKPAISDLDGKLDHMVVDAGANFSLGQRQLFCLARAMLRRSRILMLDEATASVDIQSDEAIQCAIRVAFTDCTMLTIAHRLNTIMDSDRVIVLDGGCVVENDEPAALLARENGPFTSFVEQTGRSSSVHLRGMASSASVRRTNSLLKTGASFAQGHPSQVGGGLPGMTAGMSASFIRDVSTPQPGHSADHPSELPGGAKSMRSGHSKKVLMVTPEEEAAGALDEEVVVAPLGVDGGEAVTDAGAVARAAEAAAEEAVTQASEAVAQVAAAAAAATAAGDSDDSGETTTARDDK